METTQDLVDQILRMEENGCNYRIDYYIRNGLPIPQQMPVLIQSKERRALQVIFEQPNKNYYIIKSCSPELPIVVCSTAYDIMAQGGIVIEETITSNDIRLLDKLLKKKKKLTAHDLFLIKYVCDVLYMTRNQFLFECKTRKLASIKALTNIICHTFCNTILQDDDTDSVYIFAKYNELNTFIDQLIKQKCKKTKKSIPKKLKTEVWNTYIGEDNGSAPCLCCKRTKITQSSFHCGHVIAEANGGLTTITNLRPICAQCNLSMGTTNMYDFAKLFDDNKMDIKQ